MLISEQSIDIVEFFVVIYHLVTWTFVFKNASKRQENYLIEMGFRNLKEILNEMGGYDPRFEMMGAINISLQNVIDYLKFDVMVKKFLKKIFRKKLI